MAEQDAEVIQAVLDGEIERYAELVNRYQGGAIGVALGLLGNYEDARDAAQEAFLSAYRCLGRFGRRARFSTWLYRIVVNECKDALRSRSRRPLVAARAGTPQPDDDGAEYWVDVEDATAGPAQQLANRELARRLAAAVAELPLQQRTAFTLHHVRGLQLDEVAAIMKCRIGTVKAHVFRATAALRDALQPLT